MCTAGVCMNTAASPVVPVSHVNVYKQLSFLANILYFCVTIFCPPQTKHSHSVIHVCLRRIFILSNIISPQNIHSSMSLMA